MKRWTLLRRFFLVNCCFFILTTTAQNLLDTSTWTIGSGGVTGFSQYGVTAENYRELGMDHLGNEVILWKASPNNGGAASGGFGSSYMNIDNTKDYRLSVWIKKTNSDDGNSYFKCTSISGGAHQTLRLNGTVVNYPQFWYGDLPKLDRWYLLVGFIHKSSYASTVNQGKIYDGVTGEEVQTITDYKFSSSATNLQHRAFLYGDDNTADRQYMYNPRMEAINGSELSINQLLGINEDSSLQFGYDTAGNQITRTYCDGNCAGRVNEAIKEDEIISESEEQEEDIMDEPGNNTRIYPNPTKEYVTVQIGDNNIKTIQVFDIKGALINVINYNAPISKTDVDLSQQPIGIYYIHLHFKNGESVTKRIIKH